MHDFLKIFLSLQGRLSSIALGGFGTLCQNLEIKMETIYFLQIPGNLKNYLAVLPP